MDQAKDLKHCPNPDCPNRALTGYPAEYRLEVERCSDCGTTLVRGPAPQPPKPPKNASVPLELWGRLAFTAGMSLAALLSGSMPVPGIESAEVLTETLGISSTLRVSLFEMGLHPFLFAFVLVECTALLHPRWRRLRIGGPEGRAKLTGASVLLGFFLACVQALGLTRFLAGFLPSDVFWLGRWSHLLIFWSLVAGSVVLLVAAQWIDRFGLGSGIALICVLPFFRQLGGLESFLHRSLTAGSDPLKLILTVLLIAGMVLLTVRTLRRSPGFPLRSPACGIVPVAWASSLVAFPALLREAGAPLLNVVETTSFSTDHLVHGVLAVALTAPLAYLFNRPKHVGALLASESSAGSTVPLLRRAIVLGAAFLSLLLLSDYLVFLLSSGELVLDFILLVFATATIMDVHAEWRARRRLGDLVPVWPLHQVYAVDVALAKLRAAGIPAHPRGAYVRALFHFFGPLLPIDLLVPPSTVAQASTILAGVFDARVNPGSL